MEKHCTVLLLRFCKYTFTKKDPLRRPWKGSLTAANSRKYAHFWYGSSTWKDFSFWSIIWISCTLHIEEGRGHCIIYRHLKFTPGCVQQLCLQFSASTLWISLCTFGYNEFDFFWKLRTQSLWWVQNLNLRHIYFVRFFDFWLQSLKKVLIWQK